MTGQKLSINIPLDWALEQILYSYDEGTTKSDIIAGAIRFNKGNKAPAHFVSKRLTSENKGKTIKEFLSPVLTETGRRSLLHMNIPLELYEEARRVSLISNLSVNKTISYMVHKMYDAHAEVIPTPRARKAGVTDTVRVAINFPLSLVEDVNALRDNHSFRQLVIDALEDYVRRNLNDGRGNGTRGLGL
jgi:hypothetical protein